MSGCISTHKPCLVLCVFSAVFTVLFSSYHNFKGIDSVTDPKYCVLFHRAVSSLRMGYVWVVCVWGRGDGVAVFVGVCFSFQLLRAVHCLSHSV